VHADSLRDQRHDAHDYENERDHRIFALEIVIGPADQIKHEPPPEREAREKKYRGADQAFGDVCNVDTAGLREALIQPIVSSSMAEVTIS